MPGKGRHMPQGRRLPGLDGCKRWQSSPAPSIRRVGAHCGRSSFGAASRMDPVSIGHAKPADQAPGAAMLLEPSGWDFTGQRTGEMGIYVGPHSGLVCPPIGLRRVRGRTPRHRAKDPSSCPARGGSPIPIHQHRRRPSSICGRPTPGRPRSPLAPKRGARRRRHGLRSIYISTVEPHQIRKCLRHCLCFVYARTRFAYAILRDLTRIPCLTRSLRWLTRTTVLLTPRPYKGPLAQHEHKGLERGSHVSTGAPKKTGPQTLVDRSNFPVHWARKLLRAQGMSVINNDCHEHLSPIGIYRV